MGNEDGDSSGDELVELSERVVAQQPPLRRRAPAASVVEQPGPIVADAGAGEHGR